MVKRIKLGAMRYRATLYKPVRTRDLQTGDWVDDWEVVDTVWASFDALSAREFIQSHSQQGELAGEIGIRFRSDIDMQWRVALDGVQYEIDGILPYKQAGRQLLMVKRGGA